MQQAYFYVRQVVNVLLGSCVGAMAQTRSWTRKIRYCWRTIPHLAAIANDDESVC